MNLNSAAFITIFSLSLALITQSGLCQNIEKNLEPESIKRNSVYLDLGGPGGYGSLSYQYLFMNRRNLKLGVQGGLGVLQFRDYRNQFNPDLTLPIGLKFLAGKKHFAEIGLGTTWSSTVIANLNDGTPTRNNQLHGFYTVGYQFNPMKSGISWRLYYSPLIENFDVYRHWFGTSIGYIF